jgi:hypothetical protein
MRRGLPTCHMTAYKKVSKVPPTLANLIAQDQGFKFGPRESAAGKGRLTRPARPHHTSLIVGVERRRSVVLDLITRSFARGTGSQRISLEYRP